jgi:hypothetical protein
MLLTNISLLIKKVKSLYPPDYLFEYSLIKRSSIMRKVRIVASLPHVEVKCWTVLLSLRLPSFSASASKTFLIESYINFDTFLAISSLSAWLGAWIKSKQIRETPNSSIIWTLCWPSFCQFFSSIAMLIGVAGVI